MTSSEIAPHAEDVRTRQPRGDFGTEQDVAGIDVGLTLVAPTSGICRTGPGGEIVAHTYIDRLSRTAAFGFPFKPHVIAIDAPVLQEDVMHYHARACEKVFVWGDFQRRCKCGESQVRGTGQALRRAGADTAHSFAAQVSSGECARPFPRIFGSHNVIEAFPNAFLGISLPEAIFESVPARGEKFDWLYERWIAQDTPQRLRTLLNWKRERYWQHVLESTQRDERAAVICALTAICVLRGSYVAVGESQGGYFFLPPWSVWMPWARNTLDKSRADPRLPKPVDVWIDGRRYGAGHRLP